MYKLKVDLIFCDYFYILPVARLARALLTILSFQKSICDPLCSGSASDELQLDVRFCDPSYQQDYKYKCRHVQPSTMDQFSKSHVCSVRHTKDIGLGGVRNFIFSKNLVDGSSIRTHLALVLACESQIITSSMDRCQATSTIDSLPLLVSHAIPPIHCFAARD